MHQHDRRRVGTGEMVGPAVRVGAVALVPRLAADGRVSADAAEPVADVPPGEGAGLCQQRPIALRYERTDSTQVGESDIAAQRLLPVFIERVADIDGEMADAVVLAEEDRFVGGAVPWRRGGGEKRGGWCVRGTGHRVAAVPNRQQQARRIGQPGGNPPGIAATPRHAVEAGMGIDLVSAGD